MSTDNHTIPEKILLAAADVAKLRSPWPIAQLVVKAWEKWPQTFGLHGYENQYPNANVVISAMSGKRGMVGRGCFVRINPNTYRLTTMGHEAIKMLEEGNGRLRKKNAYSEVLDGLKSDMVRKLKGSSAYKVECCSGRAALAFDDALHFFHGKPRNDILRELTELAESDEQDAGEARALRSLADHLIERFPRQWAMHDERVKR